jgi:phage host-nuclease inhibitor protein Gam
MEPKNSRTPGRHGRQEQKSAASFVECTVRVSPSLARLIRKCAATEEGGASPHHALLASAGIRAGEVEELRDQAKHLAQELRQAQEIGAQLQHTLDMTKAIVAQRDQEQIALRRQLRNAGEIEKENRQTAAAVEGQIAELQKTIASQGVDLSRSISIGGLDESIIRAMVTFKDRLSRGEDVKTAALGTAGYELPQVEAAIAKQGRDEMRALDALLMRPTWRRRVVVWLLDAQRATNRKA